MCLFGTLPKRYAIQPNELKDLVLLLECYYILIVVEIETACFHTMKI